ncbi:MAG TPA: hypothetical protein VGB84_00660 [Arachidicoccus sp.]
MKYFTKILSICLVLIMYVTNIHAQVSLLQNAIDKIESSKNLSYNESVVSKSNYNTDTMKMMMILKQKHL